VTVPRALLVVLQNGEAIGFAQFQGRKIFIAFFKSFSDFSVLAAIRYSFVLPCPLYNTRVWVTVWVRGIDLYCFRLKK
jgi:hypothetical protein